MQSLSLFYMGPTMGCFFLSFLSSSVLRIRIRNGSVFRKNRIKQIKIKDKNSPFRDSTDEKVRKLPLLSDSLKNIFFKENCFYLNFFSFFSQVVQYSITLDPDPYWAKILEPDPSSMYLGPQHWSSFSIVDLKRRVRGYLCSIKMHSLTANE